MTDVQEVEVERVGEPQRLRTAVVCALPGARENGLASVIKKRSSLMK